MKREKIVCYMTKCERLTMWGHYRIECSPHDIILFNPTGDLITFAYTDVDRTYNIENDPYGFDFARNLTFFSNIEEILFAMPRLGSILIKNIDLMKIEKVSLTTSVVRITSTDFYKYIIPHMNVINI